MSKLISAAAVMAGIGILAFPGVQAQNPSQGGLENRVGFLESSIGQIQAEFEILQHQNTQNEAVINALEAQLKAQADAAGQMKDVLKSVDSAGFTAGINPRSRELLLKGWNSQLDTMIQATAPKVDVEGEGEKPAPRTGGIRR